MYLDVDCRRLNILFYHFRKALCNLHKLHSSVNVYYFFLVSNFWCLKMLFRLKVSFCIGNLCARKNYLDRKKSFCREIKRIHS